MNRKQFLEKIIKWTWESVLRYIVVPIIYFITSWFIKEYKFMNMTTFILIMIGLIVIALSFLYVYDHARDKEINKNKDQILEFLDIFQNTIIPDIYINNPKAHPNQDMMVNSVKSIQMKLKEP